MTRTTIRRRRFGAVGAAAALLVLSACGGSGEGAGVASAGEEADPAAPADTRPQDEEAQALAFAECMRDNGVDMPDPAPGQEGLSEALHGVEGSYDQATMDQALTACEDLRPRRAHEDGHDQDRDEAMLDLAECLREQGLDVPDNLYEDGGLHDVDDDELRAAMEECRDVVAEGNR